MKDISIERRDEPAPQDEAALSRPVEEKKSQVNMKYLTENLSGFFRNDPKGYCLSLPAIHAEDSCDEETETKTNVPVIPEDSQESSSDEDETKTAVVRPLIDHKVDEQEDLSANPNPEYPKFSEDQVVYGANLEEEQKE